MNTVTVPSSVIDQVGSVYANDLLLFGSRNVSALVSQYGHNATVVFIGQAAGLTGNYTGTANISELFTSLISKSRFFFTWRTKASLPYRWSSW